MYYGNLIVFSVFDEARERGCEYQRVNGMTDLKKATRQTLKKICFFSRIGP
jgi:hypothetical protein